MPNNIYWLNRDCVTLGCNNNVLKLFGLKTLEDFVGITYEKQGELGGWAEGQAMSMKKDDMEVMATGVPKFNVEEPPLYDEQGNPIYYISSRVPLFDDEKNVIGVVGISVDITTQKETEKKLAEQIKKTEQAYRSKAEYLTTASHEIRNPVSGVEAIVKNILQTQLNNLQDIFYEQVVDVLKAAGKSQYIEVIAENFQSLMESCHDAEIASQRALDALKNLNDLHNLQIKGIKVNWEPYNIADLLKKSLSKIKHPYVNQLTVEQDISSSVPETVILDYENIHKALMILIGNAIRFSRPPNRIKIAVDITYEKNQKFLVISIQDFGVGIAESQMQHLFVSLLDDGEITQSLQYTKPSVQLPQAKMRIEASGGSLSLISTLHIGTTALLKIPYQLLADERDSTSSKIKLNENVTVPARSLLLVEDDLIAQKLTSRILRDFGYQVDIAGTAFSAIKMASENSYDLIIMDVTLPDMNGLEATRQINQQNSNKIPVIGLTSHATEEDADNCFNAGMVLVLTKPVAKEVLQQSIENVLYEREHEKDEEDDD